MQLNTYLNITNNNPNWNIAKKRIEKCAEFIEEELSDLTLRSWLVDVQVRLRI